MTNQEILNKINSLTASFQSEVNNLKKFIILHKYIDLLKTNSKLKAMFLVEKENCKKTVQSMVDGSYTLGQMGANTPGGINLDKNIDIFYSFLDYMYHTMEEFKVLKDEKKIKEVEDKIDIVFKDPMQSTMFILSFTTLNKRITNQLSKEDFANEAKIENELKFDREKSVLYFKGKNIKIKRKADFPLEHYILEYIFEQDDFDDEIYFREIAEDKLGETDYDGLNDWKKYYRACERLQEKIRIETGVDNFLIFTTGKTANVMINKKYIPKNRF